MKRPRETKGGKYDTGSKACNQGEIVTVPLKTNGGAKAITFFEVGKNYPTRSQLCSSCPGMASATGWMTWPAASTR